jgi:hypothetical protein
MRLALIWICVGLAILLGLVACTPPPQPTAVLPTRTLPPATAAVIIVTRPPLPTEVPTPRVSFDISPYLGTWDLSLRYQFDGGPVIQQIRFVGGFTLRINQDGTVDGQGSLTTAVYHEGCAANVVGDGTIQAAFEGQLQAGPSGPELVFSLQPPDFNRRERYLLNCGTFTEPLEFEQQTLWPALLALRAQPYTLALEPGTILNQTDSLNGLGGDLQGTLTTRIRLTR